MTVTGMKEAGHTDIQPLLCCVAVMTGLAVWVVSCYSHYCAVLQWWLD